jgi:hypothetical protein
MTDNMRIWSKVEKTAPGTTKRAKVGGQDITSLNGTAMIMKATEVFGPAGLGFGWAVLEERFDKGADIYGGEGGKQLLGTEQQHTVKIRFWFELDGKRGEFEQYGCTPFLYKSKYGTTTDGEAPKKSLTDAIKKSLSMLGFSADVFMGLFDDAAYVEQRKDEELIEQAEDRQAEEDRQAAERLEYIKSVIETMQSAQTDNELKKIHDVAVRMLSARRDDKAVTRISRELNSLRDTKFPQEKASWPNSTS